VTEVNGAQLVGLRMMKTESNADGVTRVEVETAPAPLMFGGDLIANPLPRRGLLYSVLVHGILVIAVVYVPLSDLMPGQVRLVTAQSMMPMHEVLLLPALEPKGSGGSVSSSTHGGDKQKNADAPSSEASARQGVVYKGPQLIVSNPAHPDNFIQTIRQPSLVAPPRLPAPMPLPPIVSIASAKPELAPPVPQPAPEMPQSKPIQVVASEPSSPRVEVPKLPLPAATSADALVHAVAADVVPAPMPKLAHQDPPPKTEKKERNILVVNAFSMPESKASIPAGELYGTFTLSPAGATAIGLAGGGVSIKGEPGMGNTAGAAAGASVASAPTTANAGTGHKPASGAGTDQGTAVRAALAPGTGTGHSGTGGGSGSGAGLHTSGNGSAPGAGFGSSPFPAITIQGGSASGRQNNAVAPVARAPLSAASKSQTNYEITIVANGSSGGGFADFGVFRDEASYTVYLDMADAGARGSNWTLQYALNSHNAPGHSVPAARAHGQIEPPYATLKSLPLFAPEAEKRAHNGTIVVFGVINRQGKFEDLRIVQSPEPGLNKFMLDALAKWTFRPAQMDGVQVAVKVLLGVPVNSVPATDSSVRIGSTRAISQETARY
jgi:hypothetical protein